MAYKKLFIFFIVPALFLSSFLFVNTKVQAADTKNDVTVLAPLPGTTVEENCTGTDCTSNLGKYVEGLFKLIIGLAAVIAVAYIIFGGIQYMTTDSWQGKDDGKKRIEGAVTGLIIVIIAWLILYTINPALLELKLEIAPSEVKGPAGSLTAPTATCGDCVVHPAGIPFKNGIGQNVSGSVVNNLVALNNDLNAAGLDWQVTEANPPTSNAHADPCHYNGTCIDASIKSPSDPNDPVNINAFLTQAQKDSKFAQYEVKTLAEKNNLINSKQISTSNASRIVVNDKATGPHFHIEFK